MATTKLLVDKPNLLKLQKEFEFLHKHFNVLHDFKEEIVCEIETKKLRLRQKTDCTQFYKQLKKHGKILDKPTFSTLIRDKLLKLLDK